MAATHEYLQVDHYPKPRKRFSHLNRAMGVLCCINGIGHTKAAKILEQYSIGELISLKDTELHKVLNENQIGSFIEVMKVKKVVEEKK